MNPAPPVTSTVQLIFIIWTSSSSSEDQVSHESALTHSSRSLQDRVALCIDHSLHSSSRNNYMILGSFVNTALTTVRAALRQRWHVWAELPATLTPPPLRSHWPLHCARLKMRIPIGCSWRQSSGGRRRTELPHWLQWMKRKRASAEMK